MIEANISYWLTLPGHPLHVRHNPVQPGGPPGRRDACRGRAASPAGPPSASPTGTLADLSSVSCKHPLGCGI